jgi:hypothetical protein
MICFVILQNIFLNKWEYLSCMAGTSNRGSLSYQENTKDSLTLYFKLVTE